MLFELSMRIVDGQTIISLSIVYFASSAEESYITITEEVGIKEKSILFSNVIMLEFKSIYAAQITSDLNTCWGPYLNVYL